LNDPDFLQELTEQVGTALKNRQMTVATAESCTGGWVAQAITSVAGSSEWFDRGFVTYSNTAKQEMLGVPETVLNTHGAVSDETARLMAKGALKNSHADVSLAVTGIAGPAGATATKPVGTVHFAWASNRGSVRTKHCHLDGDRFTVRQQSVVTALQGILDLLSDDASA